MKSGETRFIVKKLDTKKPYNSVGFRLSNGKTTIKKSTDAEDTKDKVLVQDGVFLIPLQQADTNALQGNVTLEAQINYQDHSVIMSDDNFLYINSSLGYDAIQGSEPAEDDGIEVVMTAIEEGVAVIVNPEASQELIDAVTDLFQDTKQIAQSVRDDADAGEFDGYSPQVTVKTETPSTYVLHIKDADHEFDTPNLQGQGEGGTSDYEDLDNKPKINNVELIGNKTDADLGLATKTELNAKQNVITGGNGIDVSNDVVSVDLRGTNDILGFTQGQLMASPREIAIHESTRRYLVSTDYNYPLASKSYVDNLISGRLKRLVVESLPTQDIDTNTIYMVPRSAPTTNNIYDEYMYINNAWELIGSTEVDLSNYYTKTESDNRYNAKLTVGNGIDIISDEISVKLSNASSILNFDSNGLYANGNSIANDASFQAAMPYKANIRQALLTTYGQYNFQPKLTAGTNITIDANNVISASGGGLSYTFTDGLAESSGTVGIDLKSGTELQITNDQLDIDLSDYATQTDLADKQDTIDSTHKLDADLVDDTNSTNKFVTAQEKQGWNDKADDTTISTDTSSTTVSLTLADNHEYRYTQDLTSLTLTMPSGDFISSIVFASGSTPTSMTYDSSIKWSGDDVTNGQFVPSADKDYDIMMYYNGLNINGIVRGA